MPFQIETQRLLMRQLRHEDAPGMFALDSDPEVQRYLGNQPLKSLSEAEKIIRFIQQQYADHGIGRWAVIEKASGNFIGWSGLKFMAEEVNGITHFYDLGYRFIKQYWGLGYATETALASLDYGFRSMDLHHVFGMVDVENAASNRVLLKVGMMKVGSFIYHDTAHFFYEVEREDWLKKLLW